MELRHQIAVLRSHLWILLVLALTAGAAAYVASSALPRTYEGRVTLIVGQSLSASNPDYNQILASQRLSQTYADLATTTPVLDRVIAKEALSTTAVEFRRRVTADAPRDSTLLHIVVQDSDPQRASDIANTLAAEIMASSPALVGRDSDVQRFIDQDLAATQGQIEATERELERLMDVPDRSPADEAQLDTLNGRLVGLRQGYANLVAFSSNSGANLLTVVDPAKADAEPTSPDLLVNTIIGVIAALLVAIGIVFLLDYLDDTIKSSAEVEELLGLPTLGRTGIIRSARKLNADARIAARVDELADRLAARYADDAWTWRR